jgi:aminocarboxymuconate-semialdehyde decarboxylase
MVPLQEPERAARELERLMATRLFRGAEIGTNVNGIPIGDARFKPFFAAAEALDAAVFVHALHPAGVDRLVGPPVDQALVAFPCETAFAIASLITGGTLLGHPGLRLAFSHGGGAFGLVLPRLMHGWRSSPALADAVARSPLQLARRLYNDTLVYDRDTLRFFDRAVRRHPALHWHRPSLSDPGDAPGRTDWGAGASPGRAGPAAVGQRAAVPRRAIRAGGPAR